MRLKHKVVINIADRQGKKTAVLKSAEARLPQRLLKLLFGDFTQVYLLSPGQTVESVDVKEIPMGGDTA